MKEFKLFFSLLCVLLATLGVLAVKIPRIFRPFLITGQSESGVGMLAIGGCSRWWRKIRAKAQSGMSLARWINAVVCQGKFATFARLRRARTIRLAASSASIANSIGKSSIAVIGVLTNPGQIVETLIPRFRTWTRSPSM